MIDHNNDTTNNERGDTPKIPSICVSENRPHTFPQSKRERTSVISVKWIKVDP